MKLRTFSFLFIFLCSAAFLPAMQLNQHHAPCSAVPLPQNIQPRHENNSNVAFEYCATLAQYLFFTGLISQNKQEMLPALRRFVLSDYVTHAVCKLGGFVRAGQRMFVGSLVDQLGFLEKTYAAQQGKKTMIDILKWYVPHFMRAMIIDYVYGAAASTLKIDYPQTLQQSSIFLFFFAPLITACIKDIVGVGYDLVAGSAL